MQRLNFRITPSTHVLYDRVTVATTAVEERQWSPGAPRPPRRSPQASIDSPRQLNGESNGRGSVEMMHARPWSNSAPSAQHPPFGAPESTQVLDDSSSEEEDDSAELEDEEYSTNERLLLVAFVTFTSFSLTQLYFAFRAGSEAMKGDSAAMIVDSMTYLFNWIAERRKHMFDRNYQEPPGLSPERAEKLRQRTKRKVILQLEILPPLISVSTLLVVTGIVLRDAAKLIFLDISRDPGEQSNPNLNLMLMFSLINLGLDAVNFCCFAQASHLFGFDTTDKPKLNSMGAGEGSGNLDYWMDDDYTGDDIHQNIRLDHHHDDHREHANLNMCSAYTHVFADTLRSVAVIIASALSELFDEVTAEEADAAAALVVSLLIVLSLVPLFQGLVRSFSEFLSIRAEEKSEIMMKEIEEEERMRRDESIRASSHVLS